MDFNNNTKSSLKQGLTENLITDHNQEINSFRSILSDFNQNIQTLETKFIQYIDQNCDKKQLDDNLEYFDTNSYKLKKGSTIDNDLALLLINRYNSCVNLTHPALAKLISEMKRYSMSIDIKQMFSVNECVEKYSYIEDAKKCSYGNFQTLALSCKV